jgi:hypothetical protein
MIQRIEIKVAIEIEHREGKFASREEIVEQITSELELAEMSTIDGLGEDGTTTYDVTSWDIEEIERAKPAKTPRRRR